MLRTCPWHARQNADPCAVWPRRWPAALLTLCCLLLAQPSAAQPTSEAETLFQAGLQDMRAGHYDAACPRLAASYEREALPGVLFTLAECEAAWGRPASAIDHYQAFVHLLTAMQPARRDSFEERRGIAIEMITALNAIAPEITVDVSPEVPREVVVKRRGAVVPPSAYGVSKKVDPGEYELTAELAGHAVWQRRVQLAQGDRVHIELPVSAQWGPGTALAAVASTHDALEPSGPRDRARRVRIGTVVAGSIGAAGIGIGGAAGALAWSKKSTIDRHCPDELCDRDGRRALDWAKSAALASTLGFAVGLAGAATATVLVVWSKRHARAPGPSSSLRMRPALGPRRACALTLEGGF